MLVDKKSEDTVTVAIKLVTGEEIIARKIPHSATPDEIRISRPLAMVMAENPSNPQQTRVMFTPWMIAAGKEIMDIKRVHVVAMVPARPDAAEQYEQAING